MKDYPEWIEGKKIPVVDSKLFLFSHIYIYIYVYVTWFFAFFF